MRSRFSIFLLSSLSLYFVVLGKWEAAAVTSHAERPSSHIASCNSGRMVMEFDLSGQPSDGTTRLWIPYPVSDRYQLIDEIEVDGTFHYGAVHTDRRFGNPVFYAEWPKGTVERRLVLSFRAVRDERKDKGLPENESCWDERNYSAYLAATSLGPVTGEVAILASRITRGKVTVMGKARAIYDWICDHLHRDPRVRGCGSGDVCLVLDRKGGKCVDIHSVFVALARAAGVPAREIFGIRTGKGEKADMTNGYHCWAEFYLPGYGWVVVDPADVTKAVLEKGLSKEHPEIEQLRDYFWGAVDPYRIRLSYGRDIVLNPHPEGRGSINYLMYPFAQVGEKTLDWLDPKGFSYRITWYPAKSGECR